MKSFKILVLASLLSAFSAVANAGDVPVLACFGTEPFWALSTNASGSVSYGEMGSDETKLYTNATMKNAHGTSGLFAFQVEATDAQKNTLKLNVVQTECNDGMSDNIYPYTALVDVDGGILFGCCR